jgi:hypothetical protein
MSKKWSLSDTSYVFYIKENENTEVCNKQENRNNAKQILVRKSKIIRMLARHMHLQEENTSTGSKGIACDCVNWIRLAQNRGILQASRKRKWL